MKYYRICNTAIGFLTLVQEEDALCQILFGAPEKSRKETGAIPGRQIQKEGWQQLDTPLLRQAQEELMEYLAQKRQVFTVPYTTQGTPFQKSVWAALTSIPYGETRSYKEVAEVAGCPKGFRAVGMANHANPLPILIPCHRVIAHDKALGGYGGGLAMKRELLAAEGVLVCGGKVIG